MPVFASAVPKNFLSLPWTPGGAWDMSFENFFNYGLSVVDNPFVKRNIWVMGSSQDYI